LLHAFCHVKNHKSGEAVGFDPQPSTFTPSPIPSTFTPEPKATATQSQITIIEAPGYLEPTQDIGCAPISDLKNTYTLPDLYNSMVECVNQDNYSKESQNIYGNPDKFLAICTEILRIGTPQYYPGYMIQHGMNAITGTNPDDELVKNFDSETAWKQTLND